MLYSNNNGVALLDTLEQRQALKEATWNAYKETLDISDMINYYRVVITTECMAHLKGHPNEKFKSDYPQFLFKKLINVIAYTIKCGFRYSIDWVALWSVMNDDHTGYVPAKITINDLGTLNIAETLLNQCLYSWHNIDDIKDQINNDVNFELLNNIEQHCTEEVRKFYLEILFVIWKHGFMEGINFIGKHYHVEKNLVYSKLTKLPINEHVRITPAFDGSPIQISDNVETWGIYWSYIYNTLDYSIKPAGWVDYRHFIFVVNLYRTTVGEVYRQAQLGIYQAMKVATYITNKTPYDLTSAKDSNRVIVPINFIKTDFYRHGRFPRLMLRSDIDELMQDFLVNKLSHVMELPTLALPILNIYD